MARFTLPRDIYYGRDAIEELKNLTGKKAFIVVGGGSMKRFGFLDKVEQNLRAAGMETYLFEGCLLYTSRCVQETGITT